MIVKRLFNQIDRAVTSERKRLLGVGRFIHAHPELGFEEHRAADKLSAYLESLGFKITRPYAGFETAFRAVLKGRKAGPKIAVLAEYDALAGLGHGCGHNLIATAAMAAAAGVTGGGVSAGQFEVIGTPAEESKGGKAAMIVNRGFRHLDAAIMTHPSTANKITVGCTANRRFDAVFKGKAAHAAGAPQHGINALDAALLFFNSIHALRQHLREDARIHGIITDGGEACNVIPERAAIQMGVRSLDEAYLDDLCERVATCCRTAAKAIGATVRVRWADHGYRAFRINWTLDELMIQSYAAAGIPLQQGAGREGRGSLDMGNVSQIIPAAHPYFNVVPRGRKNVALHTREFLDLANTPTAYAAALKAGTGLAVAALSLLNDKRTLRGVKKAFRG